MGHILPFCQLFRCLLHEIKQNYYFQPTLRYVSLPAASEIRDMAKNEVVMSVVIGWLADLLTVISRILDAPLRYPLHLQVSLQQPCLRGQS